MRNEQFEIRINYGSDSEEMEKVNNIIKSAGAFQLCMLCTFRSASCTYYCQDRYAAERSRRFN